MNGKTKIEYERLLELFKDVDETKRNLVDELLKKAAFLKVELDSLEDEIRKNGCMTVVKGQYIVSLAYKTFLQSLGTYQTIIKTLNSIIGKNETDEDDEFDEFINKIQNDNYCLQQMNNEMLKKIDTMKTEQENTNQCIVYRCIVVL